jgi:nucleotide-binding universal stress UspA family protein
MFAIRTILAPVDFSDRSREAAEHAARLARRFDAELLLAYVRPTLYAGGSVPASAALFERLEMEAIHHHEGMLRGWAHEAWPYGKTHTMVASGDTAKTLASIVANHNVGLVVLSTHGLGAFRRLLMGSLTRKLLHDLDCPVLTGVHTEQHGEVFAKGEYGHIAVAVALDDRERCLRTLRSAKEAAEIFGAKLTAIHAAPDSVPGSARVGFVAEREEAIGQLLAEADIEADVHVGFGEAAAYIERAAAETGADLLLVGRDPKRGVFGGLRADIYEVVRQAPIPVLSVR